MNKFKSFLQRKGVDMTWKAYFVDALGAMALGLFASLLIGTIFQTLGDKTGIEAFETIAKYAKAATGAAIAVAIAYKLKCEGLVLFSAIAVGIAGNELGGPMGAYVAVIVAAELGKIVYKETQVDILVTPAVVIISGVLMAYAVGAPIQKVMTDDRPRHLHRERHANAALPHGSHRLSSHWVGAHPAHKLSSHMLSHWLRWHRRRRCHGRLLRPDDWFCRVEFQGKPLGWTRSTRSRHFDAADGQHREESQNMDSSIAYLRHYWSSFHLCLPPGEHPHRIRYGYLRSCRTHRHLHCPCCADMALWPCFQKDRLDQGRRPQNRLLMPKQPANPLTPDQVLDKMAKYCAYQERCEKDVRDKLKAFDIPQEEKTKIIEYLLDNRFVNDERFAKSFVRGKVNQSGWGVNKIRFHLIQKGIDKEVIDEALGQTD